MSSLESNEEVHSKPVVPLPGKDRVDLIDDLIMKNNFSLLDEDVEDDLHSKDGVVDNEGDDKSEEGEVARISGVGDTGKKSRGSLGHLIKLFESKILEEKLESSPELFNKLVGCVIEKNLNALEEFNNSLDGGMDTGISQLYAPLAVEQIEGGGGGGIFHSWKVLKVVRWILG